MDLAGRIQQLEDLVKEAKSMPLSSSALVNREEVLALIEGMREAIPEEIKQARWVVRDREELLAKARSEADQVLARAREQQLEMASREAVVARAREEAERLLAEADEQARRMRREAEDYVDAKLAQLEIVLQQIRDQLGETTKAVLRTLERLEVGRERLRGQAPAEDLAPAPDADVGRGSPPAQGG
jgi:cell division septum initiation protein DivIVA